MLIQTVLRMARGIAFVWLTVIVLVLLAVILHLAAMEVVREYIKPQENMQPREAKQHVVNGKKKARRRTGKGLEGKARISKEIRRSAIDSRALFVSREK